jgi:hypothetical protein
MPCALCYQNKPLRLSHIVPEFMYRPLYDADHKFFALSPDPSQRVAQYRKGIREELLCDDCEQVLQKYEDYAARVFYRKAGTGVRHGDMLILESLDYPKFKLFVLSLIWRFGVTKAPLFKGKASLGPHAEKLRNMLLSSDPGPPTSYPFFLTVVTLGGQQITDLIVPPALAKFEAHHAWSFVVAGFLLTVFISSHAPALAPVQAFLQPNGSMVATIKEISEIPFLSDFAKQIAKAEKVRAETAQSAASG